MAVVSLVKTLDPIQANHALAWLRATLSDPRCEGTALPTFMNCTVYIDNIPLHVTQGAWERSPSVLYLARSSSAVSMNDISLRIGVLATIGAIHQLDMTTLKEALTRAFIRLIQQGYQTIIKPIFAAGQYDKLAVKMDMSQFALYMEDGWYTASGEPVEVNDTWLIMPI